jgi:pimeloyl-ACP methyl ester carboxylesterase
LGHSEGALVAELAAQNTNGICGLVLISGAGRNLGDIVTTQTQSAPPELRQKIAEIFAALRKGQTVADIPPPLMPLFRPSVQPYWISEINLDPPALLKNSKLPVLIMQGDNDIQVSVEDARLLGAARPDVKLVILPGVNHLLKLAPADRAGNIATYANPALPLAPGVVDAVADFVHDHGS